MKDASDHLDEPLPARRSLIPPLVPRSEPVEEYADVAPTSTAKGVTLRLVARALRRHWWQALIVWAVVSSVLVATAYYRIKPTYDAVSQIRVEESENRIFVASNGPQVDMLQFMENQVTAITSPTVINTALAKHPELTQTPLLRHSSDHVIDVKQAVKVGILPKTSYILVQMSSQTPSESAAVVNAVVEAYLEHATTIHDDSKRKQVEQLVATRKEQVEEVDRQRRIIEGLQKHLGEADAAAVKDRNGVSIDAYRQLSEELTRVEIGQLLVKAKLDQLRNEKAIPSASAADEPTVQKAMADLFYADPRVSSIQDRLDRVETRRRDAERLTRDKSDPSLTRHVKEAEQLVAKRNDLWNRLRESLRQQVLFTPVDKEAERTIKELESELAAEASHADSLKARLDQVRIQTKAAGGDALKLDFSRRDLQRAEDVLDTIDKHLSQHRFDMRSPIARITCDSPAVPAKKPNADRRKQAMAASPLVVGLVVTALLVLLELRGARVSDPDELFSRVQLKVIGVVPPLPQIRVGPSGGGTLATQGDLRAQRELDEFVQSLDHLRVALCARRDPWGRDRHCILITSACGSEGKTTLAAQLAERCVNAGLMTLLIDADLRNPTLSRMLDAADNPGLINVLRGEILAEDAVMVIGDAGGFHLLPAGSPRVDPSRLLQSERLGRLLAQARESFDMIIVDAPPVLPVPDALTIGRWTDGAVLAVRHDASRFPLVERANRRLAHVGVPVLGAVVNGVRSMESAYGGYYAYGSTGDGTSTSASSAAND